MEHDSDDGAGLGVLPTDMRSQWFNADHHVPGEPWTGFDPARAAIVLVDMINWQAHRDGASISALRAGGSGTQAEHLVGRCEQIVLPNIIRVLAAARAAGVTVVHARLSSQAADATDVIPSLQPYMRAAQAFEGTWQSAPLDGTFETGDLSIIKTGSGAFTGSNLDSILRNRGIRTILYAGVLTHACVLLSAAAGLDLGYRQYLITDCTGSLSEEDQTYAERFIGHFMAEPVSTEQTVTELGRARV